MSEENNQEISQEATETVTEQETTQETTQEEAQTEEQSPDVYSLSSQAAELAQRESELSRMSTQLEQRLQKVEQLETQFSSAKEDPIKALEALGLSYEDVVDKYLNAAIPKDKTESDLVLEKINTLESQIGKAQEYQEQQQQQKQQSEQQERYSTAMNKIGSFIDENSEKYELVNKMQASDLVLNVIGEHYNNTGEILDIAKACQAVEEHYEEEAERYLASDKILGKLGLTKTETTAKDGKQDTRPKTLTNNIGTTAPRYNDDRQLSRQESLEKAASLLRWV